MHSFPDQTSSYGWTHDMTTFEFDFDNPELWEGLPLLSEVWESGATSPKDKERQCFAATSTDDSQGHLMGPEISTVGPSGQQSANELHCQDARTMQELLERVSMVETQLVDPCALWIKLTVLGLQIINRKYINAYCWAG